MIGATTPREETETVRSSVPDLRASRLRPARIVILSVWCGLVAGPLEVAALIFYKTFFALDRLYMMSRHFVWLIPATDFLILFASGLILALLSLGWRRASWLAPRVLCGLTLLAPFWAATPRIHSLAGLVFVMGIASLLVPFLERHVAGFRRWVRVSFPLLVILAVLLPVSVWGRDRLKAWREQHRPLPPKGAPNVLLIVLDTVAAEHLSLHGYERPTCPTLEELAKRGIRFSQARATCSWTLPSHASMFTGRWPHELSAGWLTPLDSTYPTLAEVLGSQGYATAGFVGNTFYCGADTGLARGFTHYEDYILPEFAPFRMSALVQRPLEGFHAVERTFKMWLTGVSLQAVLTPFDLGHRKPASVVSREFLDWLSARRQPERPFFAFVNYFDVHYPYQVAYGGIHRFGSKPVTDRELDLIENWQSVEKQGLSLQEVAFVRDAYDDCVADLDERLGLLIDELDRRGILEQTWLIITSDHGESFGEHPNVFKHGGSLYQTEVHVPLLIVPPGRGTAKREIAETVSLRDLPATILDLLGIKSGSPFPGASLARFWNGTAAPTTAEPLLSELVATDRLNPDPSELLRTRRAVSSLAEGDWVYIRREGVVEDELYNLRDDPHEMNNLAADPNWRTQREHLRATMDRMTGGPLTRDRFRP
jgi:arylsulfatase A-like enzyme